MELMQYFRQLEDAGAYAVEADCVAEAALAEIGKHSNLVTVTIGGGSSGNIILSYMSDLSGDTPNPTRHARAFGEVGRIRAELRAERARALQAYRAAVMDCSFPDADTTVFMLRDELEKLREGLDKLQPVQR